MGLSRFSSMVKLKSSSILFVFRSGVEHFSAKDASIPFLNSSGVLSGFMFSFGVDAVLFDILTYGWKFKIG